MTSQLDIHGGETWLDGLTDRQRLALNLIREHGPVPSDELGAHLHADRLARGGRGHTDDARCSYCREEGRSMGEALRAKDLVRHDRGLGWMAVGSSHVRDEGGYDPATAEIPF